MKKVLIIEDNKEVRENIAELLELSNYEVFAAENGETGVEAAVENQPDLIVCDIMMPGLDGYGVLRAVQSQPHLRDTPFIFLSAKSEQSDIRKGMLLGADDYIPKPFESGDLLHAIENRLRKNEWTRQKLAAGFSTDSLTSSLAGDKALEQFVLGRQLEKFRKKQRIFTEGNHPVKLYYLEKGKVKIYRLNDEGKELIVMIINEGEFFGYVELLERCNYRVNADALEDSQIATMPKSEFEELIDSNPQVARKFIQLLASDVDEREDQLLHIAYNSLRKKVADALISVCRKFRHGVDNCVINLSRENLAAVAGTATESLIRTLTDFKEEKLIDIKEGKVEIMDMERLKKMIN